MPSNFLGGGGGGETERPGRRSGRPAQKRTGRPEQKTGRLFVECDRPADGFFGLIV